MPLERLPAAGLLLEGAQGLPEVLGIDAVGGGIGKRTLRRAGIVTVDDDAVQIVPGRDK